MKIELTSLGLLVTGRRNTVLNLRFPEAIEDLTLRRLRKQLNIFSKPMFHHSSNLQFILSPDVFMEQKVAGYFISTGNTEIRPMCAVVIALILARREPEGLGDFAIELYTKARNELAETGAITSPMTGTLASLETLFAERLAAILPNFQAEWEAPLSNLDRFFLAMSRRLQSNASEPHREGTAPVQIETAFNPVERFAQLKLSVRSNGSIIQHPTFLHGSAPRDVSSDKASAPKQRTGKGVQNAREYPGTYVDYTGKRREIPRLHGETIKGVLLSLSQTPDHTDLFRQATSVLDPVLDPETIDYLFVAQQGSNRRRQEARIGGPNIVAESAEFHVRLARAIGLTLADAHAFSPAELKKLVRYGIGLHAVDEKESVAA